MCAVVTRLPASEKLVPSTLSFTAKISRGWHVAGLGTRRIALFHCPERLDSGDCSQCVSSQPRSLTCLGDVLISGTLDPRLVEVVGSVPVLAKLVGVILFPAHRSSIVLWP